MKIATWNVNSLRVRLPHVLDWLAANAVDVLCLQETKTEDAGFPFADLQAAGYNVVHNGQKTYNGVAILARAPLLETQRDLTDFADEQKRLIAATVSGVRVICAYMPNGSEVGSDKYAYKLRWLAALQRELDAALQRWPLLVLCGDFNIAPEDRDVHDPLAWRGRILCSDPEREFFRGFIAAGCRDAFRLFEQPADSFSWWDYRNAAFRRNLGLRIDHLLLSADLAAACRECVVDKGPRRLQRPSDHAPVIARLDLPQEDA